MAIKRIQPAAKYRRRIAGWIGGHEDQLYVVPSSRREFLRAALRFSHVHRTLIWTIRVSEEKQRDMSFRRSSEIKWPAGCIVRMNPGLGSGGVTSPPLYSSVLTVCASRQAANARLIQKLRDSFEFS